MSRFPLILLTCWRFALPFFDAAAAWTSPLSSTPAARRTRPSAPEAYPFQKPSSSFPFQLLRRNDASSSSSKQTTSLWRLSTSLSSTPAPQQPVQYTLDGQDIRGEITPLGNIVLVKVKETLTATSGGILLPDQAKERPTEGVVVCAGPGKIHPFTAKRIDNPIKAGMSVLYGKFDGRPVNYNGEECQVIRDDNVLLTYQGITMKLDNVVPVRDYVLIEVSRPTLGGGSDLQTSSGVVVAAQVMKDKAICEGVVAKVGEGRMASMGNLTPSPVHPGDYVKWKDYAGNEVKIEGKEYCVVKMVDILATRRKDDGEES